MNDYRRASVERPPVSPGPRQPAEARHQATSAWPRSSGIRTLRLKRSGNHRAALTTRWSRLRSTRAWL